MNLNSRFSLEQLDPNKLLEPTSYILFPALAEATLLEERYKNDLLPPRPGAYRAGDIYPLGENKINDLIFSGFPANLYTVADTFLDTLDPKKNTKRLFSQPTVPAIGLQLIELCINREISRINPFGRDTHTNIAINRLIKYDSELTSDDIANECSGLLKQVIDFIGKDEWHIYFVRAKRNDIFIMKTIDYRIYDWHCSLYEKMKTELETKY